MGRINGENTGKPGIFPRACSPFGLDRVLILDGFWTESQSLTVPLASHPHNIWQSMA